MTGNDTLRNGYDLFISHNRADKEWVRTLARRLADVQYNGRPLRPWLDEKFLDPGELAQETELTSALDRSRLLVIVLSPMSVASPWVEFELEYFLEHRGLEEVVPLLKAPCDVPERLADAEPLDVRDAASLETRWDDLLARLCPVGEATVADAERLVETAWDAARDADPGGLDPGPTAERDALLAALTTFDIDAPASEGLAVAAFSRAADLLLRDTATGHAAAYNLKMLFGECLAAAIARSPRYRRMAHRYLDIEDPSAPDPILSWVVTRAYSKLAEMDPASVDLGALLRIARRLDDVAPLNNKKESLAMLLGRVAAKQRGTDRGDLLIHALRQGGACGRIAAIGGISMGDERSAPVYYVTELEEMRGTGDPPVTGASEPPSRRLQALLFAIDLDQPDTVRQQLENAKYDLERDFGIDDLPYGHTWLALRDQPPAPFTRHEPILGTVVKATTQNMEELALRVDASHVVCLTEPRVVDALFDGAGALVIPLQEEDAPQCRRLVGRDVPFAMLDDERMGALRDGDQVSVEADVVRVVAERL